MPTFMLYLGGKLIKTIVGANLDAIKIALGEAVVAEIPVEPEATEGDQDEAEDEAKEEATGEDDLKAEEKAEGDAEEAVEKVA